ncbi:HsdR family type I site-specific deoxyribonuclease [Alkalinema sp. FACHB-956]|uniref:type I restriction endonuclease subunit R n=1 Tax=Alkalinema sp. FACHB-956 TaxID=2692768 RepID=UPI0016839F25|nr:HsdR family type I site-specific deoxyribonuclease [Alkalinema sp. FACHB-956]MBD2329270.1 type I restriction endonuclease subunit R [Alkalinema sp. FACHB-956]
MSEYQLVEKPFLDQLAALGWHIIDHGPGIPQDPTISLRTDFRQVILPTIFRQQVRQLNRTDDGQPWLTDRQLQDLYDQLNQPSTAPLLETNEERLNLLYKHQVDTNEVTGEADPEVHLIDFQNPENNHFIAINQFRLDTPGGTKAFIIPDLVLFVNGIPLVVVECKVPDNTAADPMHEAFQQLMRYSDQRPDTQAAGLREGEPRLFYTNQLLIRTCGTQTEVGSISATAEEYFFPWKSIYPDQYATYTAPLGEARPQEQLIQGMLPKATLLDIVRNFIIFMEVGKTRVKVVCRYQQYRAANKIIDRLRAGNSPEERSGVIWHTQGSGKSLTMVFTIRKLRHTEDLKDFKVCLVCDRTDLEKQLGETAALTGEAVNKISSSTALKTELATSTSDLNMVMVHKFQEARSELPDYLQTALTPSSKNDIPEYESFGLVNASDRILLMIDEAHRTQAGDLSDNLFEAFPNATRLAFTGTPLIVTKDKQKTVDRFGQYIDKYRLQDAVKDGVTVQILYEGKVATTSIEAKAEFDRKVQEAAGQYVTSQLRKSVNQEILKQEARQKGKLFDDLIQDRTAAEILKLKQKWGTNGDLLEAKNRIAAIAQDLVNHYIDQILPNGFKAQVVCSSKLAAVRYKTAIDKAIADRLALEQAKPIWDKTQWESNQPMPEDIAAEYQNPDLCQKIAFLQSAVILSTDGTNEKAEITNARKHAKSVNAVDNFKRKFDYDDPDKVNTGVAFLIVCDMLLTGFDAPIEQVMYIDKKIREHNLLQTIARVNRIATGKNRGYIVDYIGLTEHLQEALSIYAAEDQEDIQQTLKNINHELPILETRYLRLIELFEAGGVEQIEAFVNQQIPDLPEKIAILEQAIELMEDLNQRSSFEVYLKQFLQSMDIILPNAVANIYKIPAKRFGYIMNQVKERYKDTSLNFSDSGDKIRELIDQHLISQGINPQIPPIELFSPAFIQSIERKPSAKAKASEMEHALRKHCKVNLEKDPAFYQSLSEKLEALIQKHQDDWEALSLALLGLRNEAETGRQDNPDGVSRAAAPFYDRIGQIAFGGSIPSTHQETIKQLVEQIIEYLQDTINIVNFWSNNAEVKKLRGNLSDLILESNIDEMIEHSAELETAIIDLTRARHQELVQ